MYDFPGGRGSPHVRLFPSRHYDDELLDEEVCRLMIEGSSAHTPNYPHPPLTNYTGSGMQHTSNLEGSLPHPTSYVDDSDFYKANLAPHNLVGYSGQNTSFFDESGYSSFLRTDKMSNRYNDEGFGSSRFPSENEANFNLYDFHPSLHQQQRMRSQRAPQMTFGNTESDQIDWLLDRPYTADVSHYPRAGNLPSGALNRSSVNDLFYSALSDSMFDSSSTDSPGPLANDGLVASAPSHPNHSAGLSGGSRSAVAGKVHSATRYSPATEYFTSKYLPGGNYAHVARGGEELASNVPEPAHFELQLEDFPVLSSADTSSSHHPPTASSSRRQGKSQQHISKENAVVKKIEAPPQPETDSDDTDMSLFDTLYGMAGLQRYIRNNGASLTPAERLYHGIDPRLIGVKVSSRKDTYPCFLSPIVNRKARSHECDFALDEVKEPLESRLKIPKEYQILRFLSSKSPSINMRLYQDDVLLLLYYAFDGDILQNLASRELKNRGWRYSNKAQAWICPVSESVSPNARFAFDVNQWKNVRLADDHELSDVESTQPLERNLETNKEAVTDQTAAVSGEPKNSWKPYRIVDFEIDPRRLRRPLIPSLFSADSL